MKVISLNANGIRAAARKGFFEWLQQEDADVICLQETKAQRQQLDKQIFCPAGYHCYYHDALKKGYSGVAIYSRIEPKSVRYGLGWQVADDEGRYVELDLGALTLASIYLPSGTSGEERQQVKFSFLDAYLPYLQTMLESGQEAIICGDWNIAHTKKDIKNWRSNQKNSGFLPEERAWLDTLFHEVGFVDAFRQVNQEEDQYTWWSNRGRAWDNNVGWRIDYQVITPGLADKVMNADIYKEQRFSDHAPLIINYQL